MASDDFVGPPITAAPPGTVSKTPQGNVMSTGGDTAVAGAAGGAATGFAAGGPWGALIGAGAGLFTTLLQEKGRRESEERARREARIVAARLAEQRAHETGINVARSAGQQQQSALATTLGAFRSALI